MLGKWKVHVVSKTALTKQGVIGDLCTHEYPNSIKCGKKFGSLIHQ